MLIAHLTDSHIVEKDKFWLAHPLTKTEDRLAKAINHLNQLTPRPDIVIFTGDLTDEGTEAAYQHFQEILQPLQIPLFVIPGNHDCRETMRHAFHKSSYIPKQGFLHYTIEDYPLRLIALDTLLEGEGKGGLCEERFQWLQDALKQDNNKPTLLFMHHPPVKIGMSLFDSIRCFTPTSFEQTLSRAQNLVGIVCGHYHHFCMSSLAGKPCFLAPSLAPVHYFAHPTDQDVTALQLDEPAITLHNWLEGTTLTSQIIRLKEDYKRLDWTKLTKQAS